MIPKRLRKRDTIGIVSPSHFMTEENKKSLDNTIEVLKKFDLNVVLGKNARAIDKYGFSAGSPSQRANDINEMFADSKIKGIWCFKGGFTSNQVIDSLNYDIIKNNPKIFIGLSDNTVLINPAIPAAASTSIEMGRA